MCWSRAFEVNFVTAHVVFEFNSILTRYDARILMIVVQEIMDGWLMELPRWSKCSTPYRSSAFLGNTTSVKSKIVYVVLLSFLLQLS
jgi:hypothetical protein